MSSENTDETGALTETTTPLTADALWERAQKHLTHTVTCRLVTSGYTDRYLAMDGRYELSLDNWGARVQWVSADDAMATLRLLTGRSIRDVVALVHAVTPRYFSSWASADFCTFTTAEIRPHVLEAIGGLASHRARGGRMFTAEAMAKYEAEMASATPSELECARYWLSECNRLNARTGRAQVAFPVVRDTTPAPNPDHLGLGKLKDEE